MAKRPKDGMYSRFTGPVMDEVVKIVSDFEFEWEAEGFFKKMVGYSRYKKLAAEHRLDSSFDLPQGVVFLSRAAACVDHVRFNEAKIELRPGRRNPLQVIHTVSHYLQPEDSVFHGAEFSKIFLSLVERMFDADTKRAVKDVLVKNNIKTQTVSPEVRASQSARYYERKADSIPARLRKLQAEVKALGAEIDEVEREMEENDE